MTYIVAILLGIVEGATEFIPVSSSGHLIVVRQLLGVNNSNGLTFDAVLQFATTLALVLYFWRDILNLTVSTWDLLTRKNISHKDKTLLYAIVLGTIPAVVFGLLLEKQMETVFRNVRLVALTLVLGSLLLWVAQKVSQKYKSHFKEVPVLRGLGVGFFQCLALVPGVSRSGATISGGLISGLSRDEAVRFSFLLSVPILLGSGAKKLFDVRDSFAAGQGSILFVGSIAAFFVGLISINFLIKYLKNHSLNVFIWYRIVLAALILISF